MAKGHQQQIKTEMAWAHAMAKAAAEKPEDSSYYKHFFSQALRDDSGFAAKIKTRFSRMTSMLSGINGEYQFVVTCNDGTNFCTGGYLAHMGDEKQTMNFCDAFFQYRPIPTHQDRVSPFAKSALNECGSEDLRYFQHAKAAILIHEVTHTTYAMDADNKALDYAYGYDGSTALPLGQFDRSCVSYGSKKKFLCPDASGKKEGTCDASTSEFNADSYSFVASGIFFSKKCGKSIPYPAAASSLARRGDINDKRDLNETRESGSSTGLQLQPRAQTSCPLPDWILFDRDDDDDDDDTNVVGYAHFGDSYASGMGTGVTTGDSCRVGSSNYGDLINNYLGDESIVWPGPLSCSGDTTAELSKKIDNWKTAKDTNLATLTIGGNDLGFSDLVTHCVIRPWWPSNGKKHDKECEEFKQKAKDHLRDSSDDGLPAKLRKSYLKILQKSYDARGAGLDLYVAGYAEFFNDQTDDCENTSFDYTWSGYKGVDGDDIVKLTTTVRMELNALVNELNDVIDDAVAKANEIWGSERVHYVTVSDKFEAGADHRWCSHEDVHEPVEDRKDTWFFLSAWRDYDSDASSQQDQSEGLALAAQGQITLPSCDADSPLNDFAGNDPWDVWMCKFAQAIAEEPDGIVAERLKKANADLSNGDYQTEDVSWWYPTRQIKTFHPRSRGMNAYKEAILDSMRADGRL
ncbi:SGNH hydrolase [Ustulina deusta]|nr:SGNH hydrolase [Ustulina deusta]